MAWLTQLWPESANYRTSPLGLTRIFLGITSITAGIIDCPITGSPAFLEQHPLKSAWKRYYFLAAIAKGRVQQKKISGIFHFKTHLLFFNFYIGGKKEDPLQEHWWRKLSDNSDYLGYCGAGFSYYEWEGPAEPQDDSPVIFEKYLSKVANAPLSPFNFILLRK